MGAYQDFLVLTNLINLISWSHEGGIFRSQSGACGGNFLQKQLMAKNMPLNNVIPNENPLLVVNAI